MRRREFIKAIAGLAAGWPLAANAQQPMPVIGFVRSTTAAASADLVTAMLEGLRETGYVVGQNVAIEYRWMEGRDDRVRAAVDELVHRPVNVLIAANNAVIIAAKAANPTIPIVFITGDDPVKLGYVQNLARPGGNITGVSFFAGALGGKQLELLRELVPKAKSIGMLVNPKSPAATSQISDAQTAARTLGLELHVERASSVADFDQAFATFSQQRVDALIFGGDALFTGERDRLVALAARHALPSIYVVRQFVVAGGLMSYAASFTDASRQAGVYVGRILKGAKPADMPVMLPAKFELIINMKTARTLGIDVPLYMQQRADEVIE
jgi:ABC-type uncharacterized transport system substrate-binding protein